MKKNSYIILALFIVIGGLFGAGVVQAQESGFVPIAPIDGLTDEVTANSANSLPNFLNNLYRYLVGLAAIIAIIQIMYAGFQISFGGDNASKRTEGKKRILQTIGGLVLVLSPYLVFSIINPSILNLSVAIPDIDLTFTSGSSTNGPQGVDSTPEVSGSYLVSAVSSSIYADKNNDAIKAWLKNSCTGRSAGKQTQESICLESKTDSLGNPSCIQTRPAVAFCQKYAGPFLFSINDSDDSGYNVTPIGTPSQLDSFSFFANACAQDQGVVCFTGYSKTILIKTSCPGGIVVPSNGDCYESKPMCAARDNASSGRGMAFCASKYNFVIQ